MSYKIFTKARFVDQLLLSIVLVLFVVSCGEPFERGSAGGGTIPDDISFAVDVYPALESSCGSCHSQSGIAANSGFVLSGSATGDYNSISAFVDTGDPVASALLLKGTGQESHGGGSTIFEGQFEYQLIAAWADSGAENN